MKTMMLPATGMEPALEIVHAPATGVADRSPLLFVHGLGHGAWCWHNWLEAAAAAGHQAYALSFRGHGGSEGSVAGARLRDYVADTVRAATSIADGKGVLIGHSLGGLIVQHALPVIKPAAAVLLASISAHPAIGTAISVVRHDPIQGLRLVAGLPLHLGPDMLFTGLDAASAAAAMVRMTPESALVQYQLLARTPAPLPSPSIPVLSVATTDDRVVPIRATRATARRYGATIRELEGIGHDMMLDAGWQTAWDVVDQWLHSQAVAPT
ncbi:MULTISPECIES: alpha/beta fold hydrolase [unclassified Rhodococcus (in: high G+C Gram-positive bacteria)]|jgi:pimeloyl-ACP methyl ester carboxylesterase|nr:MULTISPECIES: alpha/beta fold hydrolase [unclassified Rhodococcus (in: high G+C Gram-positive bacteria)]MDI9951399.1 alpha/beta fold hydrolase [Rhodococcus sp. IEGM 1305]MDI9976784.1 alpha/beta fold hydrolase [Rhodococcus sp. IEGM 1307]